MVLGQSTSSLKLNCMFTAYHHRIPPVPPWVTTEQHNSLASDEFRIFAEAYVTSILVIREQDLSRLRRSHRLQPRRVVLVEREKEREAVIYEKGKDGQEQRLECYIR